MRRLELALDIPRLAVTMAAVVYTLHTIGAI